MPATTDPMLWLIAAATLIVSLVIAALAGLRGWHGWLALRRYEVEARHGGGPALTGAAPRIELADLRERVRKLEAIAAGVDF